MPGLLRHLASRPRVQRPLRTRLHLETLENRSLLSIYTPAQVAHGYGVDAITLYDGGGNPVAGDGSGQTIAIVIAYDNPYIQTDLSYFDGQFGLPDPSFQKATPQGQPAFNAGWAQESALDVEWSHAMAPGANILLVEARSNSFSDLFSAVNYARNYPGVSVVSMSWGGSEFSGESNYDSYFTTPGGHNGVSFVASSGDTGGARSYPAMSPNVVSVGGTRLNLDSGDNYLSESGWSGSGGGISSYENQPAYQAGFATGTRRNGPDVAYVADPNTAVYVRYHDGWYAFGGTSVGAPQWAALAAITDEQLNLWGYDTANGRTQMLPGLYGLAAQYGNPGYDGVDFHDIVSGSAGGNPAGPGYDLVTGLGTPIAYNLVPDLAAYITNLPPSPGGNGPWTPHHGYPPVQGIPSGVHGQVTDGTGAAQASAVLAVPTLNLATAPSTGALNLSTPQQEGDDHVSSLTSQAPADPTPDEVSVAVIDRNEMSSSRAALRPEDCDACFKDAAWLGLSTEC
jgi:subtilase family serine protease